MTRAELHEFLRSHRYAVEATVTAGGAPQAAVVGIVVSEALEIFFDTLASSRKCTNLRAEPRVAVVVGWDSATAQLEGPADEPTGADLARLKALYFARFPDGLERERDPDITYVRVRPTWARFSDFSGPEPLIVELVL